MIKATPTHLEAALLCAKLGWLVLPLNYPLDNGRCSCGDRMCDSVGKHPMGDLVPHGFKDASDDPEEIRHWFTRRPNANLGIRTGVASNLVAIDLDVANGVSGIATFAGWEDEHGEAPATSQVATGGGGRHLYFAANGVLVKTTKGDIGEGVDTRGEGRERRV